MGVIATCTAPWHVAPVLLWPLLGRRAGPGSHVIVWRGVRSAWCPKELSSLRRALDLGAAKSSIFGLARNFFGSLSWFEPKITAQQQSCTQNYSVSGKKETKMFLVITQTKLGRFSWNLIHGFLNKFAIKWCKRFPPHLNSVSTLPCKTWNAHCARATIELIQKGTPEFIPPQLWPPNSPDLNPVDYRVWEISQEKM